ncbi:MAG TPA: L,D-transpeptidase family protein [Sphingomicrobium sp.]|nr:L,D-transpeptidase family protein [Sphingomicrobium sp.]
MKNFMLFGAAALAIGAALPATFANGTAQAVASPAMQSFGPRWFGPESGAAAQQLVQLLATAQADGLNPKRYNVRGLSRAVAAAQRGDPAAVQQASAMLNSALYAYARDTRHDPNVGIIYIDKELRPTAPSQRELLSQAASASSLSDYVSKMGWMNPIYGQLRTALASRMYRNEAERRLLRVNLERARALPGGTGRYVIVNPPAARLYMYENGQVVDSMRVVAGRPDPIAQTPMMNAFIRFEALNPYWNSPPDITSRKLAPTILKEGRAYFTKRGYDLVDHFGPNANVLNPMSVDWKAVAAGRLQVNLRQRPGPANSMGKMKFMFPNPQGIWLHDTPEKEKIDEAARLQSNGCVRLEDAPRFARWLFNGRPPKTQGARPEQKVSLPTPVPLYITYLTAVPSGSSIVYFDDFYGKDRGAVRRVASR